MTNKDIPPEVQQEAARESDRVRATILEASEAGLPQPGPMFNSSPRRTTTSQEKYAPGDHNVPGTLKIIKWNIDHPVVCMNAVLVVILVSGAVLFWGRIALLQAAGLIALLALVDYRVSRRLLHKRPLRIGPPTELYVAYAPIPTKMDDLRVLQC